jgi:LysM repeat protein
LAGEASSYAFTSRQNQDRLAAGATKTIKELYMADFEQLKQKYAPVIQTIESFSAQGARVDKVEMEGDKLHLVGSVPSQVVLSRVWDVIKQVDPSYSDLHHELANQGQEQRYTLQSGDSLSKVSRHFYGSVNHYNEIARANNIADPDKVRAGQEIVVPVLNAA